MSSSPAASAPCPNCGATSQGKFCSECGAALLGVHCGSCNALLTPGAKFCHRCGTTVGSAAAPRAAAATAAPAAAAPRSILPWVVAGAALLALVIMVAAQQGRGPAPAADAGATPLGGGAPFAGGAGAGGAVRAPDISNMTPRERADRLYDRVMTMSAAGKADSAAFFASMAVGAYEALAPLDNDLRYDYGRMAEMAGDYALAKAQADSIFRENPDHLLALILAARVAQAKKDEAGSKKLLARLVAAEKTEMAKSLEEYARHKNDIDAAVALGRK